MASTFRIRPAAAEDAAALAALSAQLGYPSDTTAMTRRLRAITEHGAGAVLVAEFGDGGIAGWAHVLPQRRMEHDPNVELAGIIIDENRRGAGVGATLLRAVETWARGHGFTDIVVRSNVVRKRAHRFYLREGYAEKKRQAVFVKQL